MGHEEAQVFQRIQASLVIPALALVLVACGSTSQAPVAAPAALPPTAAPARPAAAPAAGARTFRIVPEQTEASYEVQEQFLNRSLPNKAIGKTNAVEGEFQFRLDGQPSGQVTRFVVDLRTLTSDQSRRDNRIRRQ